MRYRVLYDGNCSFCKWVKGYVERLDKRHLLNFEKLQEDSGIYFNQTDLLAELHVVSENGRIYRGFSAIRRILRTLPVIKWGAFLLYLPLVPILGEWIYRLVARNRGKIWRFIQKIRKTFQIFSRKNRAFLV